MKQEFIRELFEKFEQACYVFKDVECWSARELQEIFNYAEWRNGGAGEWIDERIGGCCADAVCLLSNSTEWGCGEAGDCQFRRNMWIITAR
jgi:hypothetical protein